MRKDLRYLLLLIVVMCSIPIFSFAQDTWDGTVASSFGGGDGTESNPYLINSAEEFAYWAEISKTDSLKGKFIKLMVGIYYNNSKMDMPSVSAFAGTFDGNANKIQIDCQGQSNSYGCYYYMIRTLDGTVKNLNFSSTATNVGKYKYGAPASLAYKVGKTGIVYNCYLENYGASYFCAAPVCDYLCGTMEKCHIIGTVSSYEGYSDNSAPVGVIEGGNIIDCMTSLCGGNYWCCRRSHSTTEEERHPISLAEWKTEILGTDTEYTITYHESGSPALSPSIIKVGTSFTLPKAVHPDLTFAGWYNAKGSAVGESITVNENTDLTAYWKREIITQPTASSPTFSIQDAQDAQFQWYQVGEKEQAFESWISTNHSDDTRTSHTYSFTAAKGQTLTIDWSVSSEAYDYLRISVNNNSILSKSGEASGTTTYTIPATGSYTVMAVYSKDDDGSEGQDMACIKSIKLSNELITLSDATTQTLPQSYIVKDGTYLCKADYTSSPSGINHIVSASTYWSESFTISQFVLSTGISLDKTSLEIKSGEVTTLSATISPTTATNKIVVWSSSDDDIVTVSNDGTITGIKEGTATITATTTDGTNLSASCVVAVTEKPIADTDISQYSNVIYTNNVEMCAGGNVTLPIKMKNNVAMTGYQFNLYAPSGIDLSTATVTKTKTRKEDNVSFSKSVQADGSLKVVCYTSDSETFSGNDGEVCTVTFQIPTGYAVGDYPIYITNQRLTASGTTYNVDDNIKSTLTVKDYILGDANSNGEVEVGDLSAIVGYILNTNIVSGFNEKAADANCNNEVEVGDLSTIVKMILGTSNAKGMNASTSDLFEMSLTDKVLYPGKEATVYVQMDSKNMSGLQFDITLPEGVTCAGISPVKTRINSDYFFGYNSIEENTSRVLCYSPSNTAISGDTGDIVAVNLKVSDTMASGDYEYTLTNVRNSAGGKIADVTGILHVSDATGINDILSEGNKDAVIYDINGRKIGLNAMSIKSLPKGVYIVNGEKYINK